MQAKCIFNLSKTFSNSIDELLDEFDFVKNGKKGTVANIPCVFDIEATSFYNEKNEKQATMYAWVLGINGKCIRGRTWSEFLEAYKTIVDYFKLSTKKRIIIYVHNLAYEFQWFRKMFDWLTVFSTDTRKPLYALTNDGVEFRCSYLLTGYSLEVLGENLHKYKVNKKVGDLDYKLIRHSGTPLNEKEWGYILNDGLVVMAHIQEEIERLGDITKIPLTKTGYVRQLCKENCIKKGKYDYLKKIKNLTLTSEDYEQLKRTYMGGFTHANVNYVDKVMKNVSSFDFTSSYPAVMVSEMYPMSKFIPTVIKDENDFVKCLNAYCCMFDIEFINIRSKVQYENYISLSRCSKIEHYVLNNGRIREASLLRTSLTEQDFFIILQMYEWDSMRVCNFKRAYKGYLPKEFIITILELYKNKTELKGVEEKIVEYTVQKNMINSMYGMCVTDICKDEQVYKDNLWTTEKANKNELLEKYNNSNERFLFYAWGVWVTAYARRNLFSGITEFGNDYIYSDTDSIKVLNIDKHIKYIEEYNKTITKKVKNCLSYYNIPLYMAEPKTIKGVKKPIGVWDNEGVYDRFKTMGAKRYLTEKHGELSITIAGVGKKAGIEYLKHKYKTNDSIFKHLEENLYFPATYIDNGEEKNGSGKMCHTYIDTEMSGEIIDYLGNKSNYHELSGVFLENTDYTLSLENDFKQLILGIKGGQYV